MTSGETYARIENMYMVRYGEFLFVTVSDRSVTAEVWGTQFMNDCPQDLWDAVDTDALAKRKGATLVMRNGPRYWTIDTLARSGDIPALVSEDFDGLTMRLIATVSIPLEAVGLGGYVESRVDRETIFTWRKGRRVYELTSFDGVRYVMQALSRAVDPNMSEADLVSLGNHLRMPEGWRYDTRVLDEELVCDTRTLDARVLQDEFQNSYTVAD